MYRVCLAFLFSWFVVVSSLASVVRKSVDWVESVDLGVNFAGEGGQAHNHRVQKNINSVVN